MASAKVGEVGGRFCFVFLFYLSGCLVESSVRLAQCVGQSLAVLVIIHDRIRIGRHVHVRPSCTRGVPRHFNIPRGSVVIALSLEPIARVVGPPLGSSRSRTMANVPFRDRSFKALIFSLLKMNTDQFVGLKINRGSVTFTRPLKIAHAFCSNSKNASSP